MKKVSDMASNVPHAAIQKHLVLAGRPLQDLLSDLFVTREQLDAIGSALLSTIDWVDILFLLTVSFCTVPLARLFCNAFRKTEKTPPGDEAVDRFQSTYTYHVALNISQIVRIATVIYVSDCFIVIAYMQGIDIALAKDVEFAPKVAKVLYMIWFAQKCMHFKRYLLGRIVNKSSKKLGNVHIFDRILDAIIYTSLVIFIMDILDVEIGSGIKSLFAFGGIGTLIFSLASKDIATLFVSGIVLSTSEKFLQGDFIELGDKTCGTVVDTGFLYTSIRGSDEKIRKIPNTQLANQRLSNLSRMTNCQVRQTLRFHYADLDKVPALITSIKQEIEANCPKLIKDGSRPYRVNLNAFKDDHFELVVDTRHTLPPIGLVYWNNRQKVLEAIAAAVAKNDVQFAIPQRRILGWDTE